jgi:RNA polymerase sigma factor (sigma-70 family)
MFGVRLGPIAIASRKPGWREAIFIATTPSLARKPSSAYGSLVLPGWTSVIGLLALLGAAPALASGPFKAAADGGHNLRDVEREAAISELFDCHYAQLVRLAVLIGADDEAEDIVDDAFCVLHRRWYTLRQSDAALSYLRSVICNLTRMRLRHHAVVRHHQEEAHAYVESPEAIAELREERREVIAALRRLPGRQREALVLRYWLGLCETDVARAMGISRGAVKAHTARGMAGVKRSLAARQ